MPNRIIFNQKSYGCRWGRTVDRDGQWQQITFSFSRSPRVKWPVEHYVRTGRDMYMLQYRIPSFLRNSDWNDCIYHEVPVKILRCLSSSRSVLSPVMLTVPHPFAFGGPETSSASHTGRSPTTPRTSQLMRNAHVHLQWDRASSQHG